MSDTLFIDASTYPTIQAAIDAALAGNALALILPDGNTEITEELVIPVLSAPNSRPLTILGRRHRGIDQVVGTTLIAATPGMRSILAVLSAQHRIQDVKFDANRNATYGLYLQNIYESQFDNVIVLNAITDGWYFVAGTATTPSNNDSVLMTNCWAHANGTVYLTADILEEYQNPNLDLYATVVTITGRASTTAGDATITIDGGQDLTTLGVRASDFVRVGDPEQTAFFGRIDSVTANTIVLQPAVVPQTSGSGLPFAIFVGYGVNLAEAQDNNILVVSGGCYRGSAATNFNVQGLFGSTFLGCTFQYGNFAGFSVGRADTDYIGQGTMLQNCYFEANQAAEIWADHYTDVTVVSPMFESVNPKYKIRPEVVTASPAQGVLVSSGVRTLLPSGTEQNFVFELTNANGTIQHRFVADFVNGGVPAGASQINNIAETFTPTPTVGPTTGFAAGAGIPAGIVNRIVFDTAEQIDDPYFRPPAAFVEVDTTGNGPRVYVTRLSCDVAGATASRFAIGFVTSTGAAFPLDAEHIPDGTQLVVRFAGGYIR